MQTDRILLDGLNIIEWSQRAERAEAEVERLRDGLMILRTWAAVFSGDHVRDRRDILGKIDKMLNAPRERTAVAGTLDGDVGNSGGNDNG